MHIISGLFFMAILITPNAATWKIDFGESLAGTDWRVINDGVMGGLSQGQGYLTDSSLVFEGRVSLENNGGFASLRAPYAQYNLENYTEVCIRCRTRGQSFALVMETSPRWYDVNYKAPVATKGFDWEVITLPLLDFQGYQVGRKKRETLKEDLLSEIIRFGFITNDKRASEFALEIDWIEFR